MQPAAASPRTAIPPRGITGNTHSPPGQDLSSSGGDTSIQQPSLSLSPGLAKSSPWPPAENRKALLPSERAGGQRDDPGPGCQHHLPTAGFQQDVLQSVLQHQLHQRPKGWMPGGTRGQAERMGIPTKHTEHPKRLQGRWRNGFVARQCNFNLFRVSWSSPAQHLLLLPQLLVVKNLTQPLPGLQKFLAGRGFLLHFFPLSIPLSVKIRGSRAPGWGRGALSPICWFLTTELGEIRDGFIQTSLRCVLELAVLQEPTGRKKIRGESQKMRYLHTPGGQGLRMGWV